jgi:hypothetical protein
LLKKHPVALLIFNRPKNTAHVLGAIRAYKPETLLVVADGPRPARPDDITLCADTRAVVENGVDWPCNLKLCYADSNMGCGIRVSSGLDWVFSDVEEAIILEDDTVPNPTFFAFCGELLERYRNEPKVFSICGDSVIYPLLKAKCSYRFSSFFSPWGWATWRDRWAQYDFSMKFWPSLRDGGRLSQVIPEYDWRDRWSTLMDATAAGKIDTWDYQWISLIWQQRGLVIQSTNNLIMNIGTGADASHTLSSFHPRCYRNTKAVHHPLMHPSKVFVHLSIEHQVRDSFMRGPTILSKILSAYRYFVYKLRSSLFSQSLGHSSYT